MNKQPTSASEGGDHTSPTSPTADVPNIPDGQTESAMILKAANAGIEAVTRIDSIMSQATAKVATASELDCGAAILGRNPTMGGAHSFLTVAMGIFRDHSEMSHTKSSPLAIAGGFVIALMRFYDRLGRGLNFNA